MAPLALALALATAAGTHLDDGEAALQGLEYSKAKDELDQARQEPGHSRAELIRLLQAQGEVAAILGDDSSAQADFRELLILDPAHVAPDRWSPKVQTPFFEAKSWAADHPRPSLGPATGDFDSGRVVGLRFQLGPDPLSLAKTLRVHPLGGDSSVDVTIGTDPLEAKVAPAPKIQYWVEVLDDHSAVLLTSGDADHPLSMEAPVASGGSSTPPQQLGAAPAATPGSPLRTAGYVTGGAGVALIAVGSIFGVEFQQAQSQINNAQRDSEGRITSITRAHALQINSASQTDAILANTLWITGGLALASGVGLWLGGTFVSVAPEPGGVSMALATRWP